jgi:hypothetical protein
MKFELNDVELANFEKWKEFIIPVSIEYQKRSIKVTDPFYEDYAMCWGMGFPYCGAIGGQFSFRFSTTSIGTTVVVIDNVTKAEYNITDWSCF